VVQVIDQASGEILYTLRILGTTFRPKVFRQGVYTVKVGQQPDRIKTIKDVKSLPPGEEATLNVAF
jgi:hypothetical protein